ncbi:hypothetical protein Bca52824_081543 [Brassica carinata]|uniref:Uncharacterized protein n=1 Tax=Brassica carinata TaxID=52824 RepID=A0A8X7PI98_BRACI|nr:hypothetical protein Bca52824_081543 [Brassica carinata]
MREKRTVTNEPINQKSRDAGGFTFYPEAAYLPPVSSSAHHDCRMKQTRSNGIGGGLLFLSAALRDGRGVNGAAVDGVLGRGERVGVGEGRKSSERRRQRRIHGFRERKQRRKKKKEVGRHASWEAREDASMDVHLRQLVPGKVSEDDKLVEYDALLLDRFLDILQDLHGEDLRETVQELYEHSAEYEGKHEPEKLL